jgi:hypothetical protein
MTLAVGVLNLEELTIGYLLRDLYGGRIDGIPGITGKRVLIPGREGYYTPENPPTPVFEVRRLLIGMKGIVAGSGSNHAAIVASFATRFAALRSACDVATRQDVTLENDGYTIDAGFLRFEGPSLNDLAGEARAELVIEFEATDPPEWTPTGS